MKQLGIDPEKAGSLTFYEGQGCPNCTDTGYRGRLALYEVMEMSEGLSNACIEKSSNNEIKAIARREGMRTLRDSGIVKVLEGLTTVSEVLSVTYEN